MLVLAVLVGFATLVDNDIGGKAVEVFLVDYRVGSMRLEEL